MPAGSFPLTIPRGKGLVLGLINSKLPTFGPIDALKRRIDEATQYIDLGRLAIGPQCGFASTVAGNPLTEAGERAKLAPVPEAAPGSIASSASKL